MSGNEVGYGIDGEPLLEPTSIKPRAIVSRSAVNEFWENRYKRAFGGPADRGSHENDNGTYLVGELAPELFVPDRMRYIIPESVMSKIPKRDQGGNVRKMGSGVIEVGSRGPHLFTPPEDGWIVPHNLTGQVSPNIPRAAGGRSPLAGLLRTLKRNPADEAIADAVTSMRADARAELDLIEEGAVGALKQVSGSSPKTVMANIIASPNRQSLMQRQHRARTLARLTMHDWEMRGGGAEIAARGEATRPILAQAQAERGALLQYQQAKQADLTGLEARARKKLGVGAFTPDQVQAQMQAMAPVKYDQLTRIIKRNTEGLTKADAVIGKMTTTVAAGEAAQKSHTEALGHVTRAYEEAAPQLKDKMSAAVQTFAGFSLYGLAQQGISTALAAAVPQVTKWIDSVGGFTAENQKVTKQIGASLRQNGGNLTTTMGQLAMTSGLSGGAMGFLGASLGASSYAKGGGAAQTEKSDLFKAAANTTAPTGLVGGYGGLFGTNILGELLGGGKGYAEQIGLDTKDLAGKARGEMDLGKVFTNAVAGTPLVGGAAQMLGFGHANPMVSPEEARASAASLMAYSDDLNDAMKRGARAAGQTAYHFEQVGKDAAEATHWSDNLGTEAQDMAKGGLVLKDAAGQLVTGTKEYNTALQQGARGNTIATQEAYAAQQAQGLSATFASNAAQSSYALKMSLGGLGLGLAASPFVAGGTGILPGSSPTGMGGGWDKSVSGGFGKGNQYMGTGKSGLGAGFDKQMQAQIAGIDASQKTVTEEYNKYLDDMVAQLQKSLPAEVQIGPAPTVGYQSTPDHGDSGVNQTPVSTSVSTWDHGTAATAYSASSQLKDWTDQLKTSGKVIQGYNEQIGNIQAGQSSRSFANNMVMASRALSDALGLAGRAGGSNNLGAVQRQQTMLGFGMQQKQINFSVAMAGFQAPGLTSEERAARQEQAKIEAAYAQKQLNLSRQSFGITAGRGVEDAQRALVSLRADRAAELMIAAVNKKMATEVAHQATLQAKIQAKTQEAQGNFGAVLNAATGYVQTFGDTLQKATSAIATVLGIPDPYAKHASGIVGSTTGTTSMTVGEAGTEHVAVIRNPRMASLSALGGASGGATIVNVGGISLTVQGDVKDDATVAKITRAVEDMFNRKAARLGMRTYVSAQG
jgi:hypothetical protein